MRFAAREPLDLPKVHGGVFERWWRCTRLRVIQRRRPLTAVVTIVLLVALAFAGAWWLRPRAMAYDVARSVELSTLAAVLNIPPPIVVLGDAPVRLNVLVMGFDFSSFYGGMAAIAHFARRAALRGWRVRWVNLGDAPSVAAMRTGLARFKGLERLTEEIEFAYHGNRTVALTVSPLDVFVATQFLSAHVAAALIRDGSAALAKAASAAAALPRRSAAPTTVRAAELPTAMAHQRFVYFIQDAEHTFFAHGSWHALALESYALPHYALFSFAFLREYFARAALGVFSPDAQSWPLLASAAAGVSADVARAAAPRAHLAYEFPVAPLTVPTESALRRAPGAKRRLLLYARPEDHAQRNMFTLAMLALAEAVRTGLLAGDAWELHGVGAKVSRPTRYYFSPHGAAEPSAGFLEIQPRVAPDAYAQMLTSYDVGLALMLSPHPSIPPFDFAAAGLITVTNVFGPKSADAMGAISKNLIAVDPTVGALVRALAEAIARVDDLGSRVRGSRLALASNWDDPEALGSRAFAALAAWTSPFTRPLTAPPQLLVVLASDGLDAVTPTARALADGGDERWRLLVLSDSRQAAVDATVEECDDPRVTIAALGREPADSMCAQVHAAFDRFWPDERARGAASATLFRTLASVRSGVPSPVQIALAATPVPVPDAGSDASKHGRRSLPLPPPPPPRSPGGDQATEPTSFSTALEGCFVFL